MTKKILFKYTLFAIVGKVIQHGWAVGHRDQEGAGRLGASLQSY